MVDRRKFLKSAGVASTIGITGLSGCLGGSEGDDGGFPDPTEFLMSPTDPQETMNAQYQPVADHLGEELDTNVELTYSASYSAVISAMGSGSGHIGETGPFAAALGIRSEELDILLQRYAFGGWDYSSVIVTREDTDIESLEDLEGKTIAFADRLSSSGSLYPLYMLKTAGIDIGDLPSDDSGAAFDPTFSGHFAAMEQLQSGTADAAGVGMFAAVEDGDEEAEEYLDGIQLVAKEGGIPRAPIVCTPEFSDDEKQQVIDAFEDAPDEMYLGADGEEDGDDDENPDDLWFSDVREADAETYQPVVDVANELGIESDLLDQDA